MKMQTPLPCLRTCDFVCLVVFDISFHSFEGHFFSAAAVSSCSCCCRTADWKTLCQHNFSLSLALAPSLWCWLCPQSTSTLITGSRFCTLQQEMVTHRLKERVALVNSSHVWQQRQHEVEGSVRTKPSSSTAALMQAKFPPISEVSDVYANPFSISLTCGCFLYSLLACFLGEVGGEHFDLIHETMNWTFVFFLMCEFNPTHPEIENARILLIGRMDEWVQKTSHLGQS